MQGTCGSTHDRPGSANINLQTLIDLSLVECDASGCLGMHDAIASMAHHIIQTRDSSPRYYNLDADILQQHYTVMILFSLALKAHAYLLVRGSY